MVLIHCNYSLLLSSHVSLILLYVITSCISLFIFDRISTSTSNLCICKGKLVLGLRNDEW